MVMLTESLQLMPSSQRRLLSCLNTSTQVQISSQLFLLTLTAYPAFLFVQNIDFKVLYPRFTDFDVRYYILELLKVRTDSSIQNQGDADSDRSHSFRLWTFAIQRVSCTEMSNHITS